jgi:hypothetical protein
VTHDLSSVTFGTNLRYCLPVSAMMLSMDLLMLVDKTYRFAEDDAEQSVY